MANLIQNLSSKLRRRKFGSNDGKGGLSGITSAQPILARPPYGSFIQAEAWANSPEGKAFMVKHPEIKGFGQAYDAFQKERLQIQPTTQFKSPIQPTLRPPIQPTQFKPPIQPTQFKSPIQLTPRPSIQPTLRPPIQSTQWLRNNESLMTKLKKRKFGSLNFLR